MLLLEHVSATLLLNWHLHLHVHCCVLVIAIGLGCRYQGQGSEGENKGRKQGNEGKTQSKRVLPFDCSEGLRAVGLFIPLLELELELEPTGIKPAGNSIGGSDEAAVKSSCSFFWILGF